jgi:peroxiredoxin
MKTPPDSFASPDDGARRAALAMLGAPLWARWAAGLTAGSMVSGCSSDDHNSLPAAPDFGYTLLDGTRAHSQALQGQVVLVNFWATTCAICVKEMPRIVDTHQRFAARGLQTLAVAVQYDPPALVADFAERRRLPFGVVIDNTGAIAKAFGNIRGTPTTLVINRRSRIVKRIEGEPDFDRLQALIDQLLAQA